MRHAALALLLLALPAAVPARAQAPGKAGAGFTLSGTIRWTDRDGGLHPVRRAYVTVWDEDDGIFDPVDDDLGTTRTDNDGRYSLFVEDNDGDGAEVYLQVFAHSEKVDVLPPGARNEPGGKDASYAVTSAVRPGIITSIRLDLDIPNTGPAGQAFSILDGVLVAADFAEGRLGGALPLIPVEYPFAYPHRL